ncbi:methionyl-tRNA formyltransferase [Legionella yabuuchiae]|uniref:methionyl-tRNA formyltransferase n=1 Tax=Legionella yabuuchiae TaxID=376727 RepID=UPI001056E19E|nr:methionyl-tRNA formyltransferase [Legionella yabuuchiae]
MNFIFLGCTNFSKEILINLIENNYIPKVVFTIPEHFAISYAKGKKVKNYNYANLETLCLEHGIPIEKIESGKNPIERYADVLEQLSLDFILVMGWYYMVPKEIRNKAKTGAWGIHASLLPNYAGGAPLVWAIINGEKETGVTLFRLDSGVDDGDIIDQRKIIIKNEDSIKDVYDKAISVSKTLLIDILSRYPNITFSPQVKENIKIFPQRSPEDGEINLNMPAMDLYNFIRAQSAPYPGAFIRTIDGKKLIIEKARVE